jgi:hypothetical protein
VDAIAKTAMAATLIAMKRYKFLIEPPKALHCNGRHVENLDAKPTNGNFDPSPIGECA